MMAALMAVGCPVSDAPLYSMDHFGPTRCTNGSVSPRSVRKVLKQCATRFVSHLSSLPPCERVLAAREILAYVMADLSAERNGGTFKVPTPP